MAFWRIFSARDARKAAPLAKPTETVSSSTHLGQSSAPETMNDAIITPDNVTKEELVQAFDAAMYQATLDGDGDLQVVGAYKLWVRLSDSKRHLRFTGVFRLREGTHRAAHLELANRINDEVNFVRAAVSGDAKQPRLCFDHYVSLDGGVTRRNIILSFKLFESIIQYALTEKDKESLIP